MKPYWIVFVLITWLGIIPGSSFAQERLVVAGTGSSQVLLRILGQAFEQQNPGSQVIVPDSVGSSGGIKMLKTQKADLARTARPLKSKEMEGLTEYLFARSPVAVVAHPSVSQVTGLSQTQFMAVFSRRYTNWQDVGGRKQKIYIVERQNGSASRKVFEKLIPGFADIQPKKAFYNVPETISALREHEYTIGYVPYSEIRDTELKVLAIDQLVPTDPNYPYTTPLYLISHRTLSKFAQKFIDFVMSQKAASMMQEFGVIPQSSQP